MISVGTLCTQRYITTPRCETWGGQRPAIVEENVHVVAARFYVVQHQHDMITLDTCFLVGPGLFRKELHPRFPGLANTLLGGRFITKAQGYGGGRGYGVCVCACLGVVDSPKWHQNTRGCCCTEPLRSQTQRRRDEGIDGDAQKNGRSSQTCLQKHTWRGHRAISTGTAAAAWFLSRRRSSNAADVYDVYVERREMLGDRGLTP